MSSPNNKKYKRHPETLDNILFGTTVSLGTIIHYSFTVSKDETMIKNVLCNVCDLLWLNPKKDLKQITKQEVQIIIR